MQEKEIIRFLFGQRLDLRMLLSIMMVIWL